MKSVPVFLLAFHFLEFSKSFSVITDHETLGTTFVLFSVTVALVCRPQRNQLQLTDKTWTFIFFVTKNPSLELSPVFAAMDMTASVYTSDLFKRHGSTIKNGILPVSKGVFCKLHDVLFHRHFNTSWYYFWYSCYLQFTLFILPLLISKNDCLWLLNWHKTELPLFLIYSVNIYIFMISHVFLLHGDFFFWTSETSSLDSSSSSSSS